AINPAWVLPSPFFQVKVEGVSLEINSKPWFRLFILSLRLASDEQATTPASEIVHPELLSDSNVAIFPVPEALTWRAVEGATMPIPTLPSFLTTILVVPDALAVKISLPPVSLNLARALPA